MQYVQVSVPTEFLPKALSFKSIELLPTDQRLQFVSCVLEAVQFPESFTNSRNLF